MADRDQRYAGPTACIIRGEQLDQFALRLSTAVDHSLVDQAIRMLGHELSSSDVCGWPERSVTGFLDGVTAARSVLARDARLLAGHGIGELVALVSAGAIEPRQGLELALARGRAIEVATRRDPGCGMISIRGAADAQNGGTGAGIARRYGLVVVSIGETGGGAICSGPRWALDAAAGAATRRGLEVEALDGMPALHSPSMEPATAYLARRVGRIELKCGRSTVVSAACATVVDDPLVGLMRDLTSPVRWADTTRELRRLGATTVEVVDLLPAATPRGAG